VDRKWTICMQVRKSPFMTKKTDFHPGDFRDDAAAAAVMIEKSEQIVFFIFTWSCTAILYSTEELF
jgi:hypothetical protein